MFIEFNQKLFVNKTKIGLKFYQPRFLSRLQKLAQIQYQSSFRYESPIITLLRRVSAPALCVGCRTRRNLIGYTRSTNISFVEKG